MMNVNVVSLASIPGSLHSFGNVHKMCASQVVLYVPIASLSSTFVVAVGVVGVKKVN